LVISLNFENPILVSSLPEKDLISVKVLTPFLFMSTEDRTLIKTNFSTANFTIPAQAKSSTDFLVVDSIASSVQYSMQITLVIPFAVMLLMSVGMNRVWSLYLMLQLFSNIANFKRLLIPANALFMLQILKNISFFRFFQTPEVQVWLKENVFRHLEMLQFILFGQGTLLFTVIALIVALALLYLVSKIKKLKAVKKLQENLMWSALIRS
jgi:hypothetical protein